MMRIVKDFRVTGIGRVIKESRLKYQKETGESVGTLCKKLGVHRSYWYQLEDDNLKKTIALTHIQAIEELFGVELVKVVVEGKDIKVEVIDND